MNAKRNGWSITPWTAHLSPFPEMGPPDPERLAALRSRLDAGEDVSVEDYLKALPPNPIGRAAATVAPAVQGSRTYHGARIRDDAHGVTYEVAAERVHGKPRVVILSVIPHTGTVMDARTPVPVAALARAALDEAEAKLPIFRTRADRDIRDGDDHAPRRPRLAQIAAEATSARQAAGSPRRAIAAKYGISLRTADGWLRAARDGGALPAEARDNRGRRPRQRTNSDTDEEQDVSKRQIGSRSQRRRAK